MKLKYYLRGLGIGIIITTLILMIAGAGQKKELTDEEIIKRAEALGMVMEEDQLFSNSEKNNDTEKIEETEVTENTEPATEQESETVTEIEQATEDTSETVPEVESEVESESEIQTETEQSSETESEMETEIEVTGESYHLVIKSGAIPRLICAELEENGVIEDAASLRKYLTDVGFVKYISVGEYDIPYGSSNEEVYQILKAGSKR